MLDSNQTQNPQSCWSKIYIIWLVAGGQTLQNPLAARSTKLDDDATVLSLGAKRSDGILAHVVSSALAQIVAKGVAFRRTA